MVGCSGYLHAMNETGIMDCVLYMAGKKKLTKKKKKTTIKGSLTSLHLGVSGSTWAMSQFYSPLTNASVSTLKDHLSSRIHTHIANLSNFLTVLNASRHNSKIILHGVIQRYYQQNGTISLVDIFGMLLGGTLLSRKLTITPAPPGNENQQQRWYYSEDIEEQSTQNGSDNKTIHEDDGAEVKPRLLKKDEIKLSKQRVYFEDGSLPMPIYCAVRHEIETAGVTKAGTVLNNKEKGENEDLDHEKEEDAEEGNQNDGTNEESVPKSNDLYQWFEFTPYDMGSEEINGKLWIVTFSFCLILTLVS